LPRGELSRLRPLVIENMAKIASIIVAALIPFVVLAFWPLYLSRPFEERARMTKLTPS
jgi:hypothetical protein